jgi:hypothetical protein
VVTLQSQAAPPSIVVDVVELVVVTDTLVVELVELEVVELTVLVVFDVVEVDEVEVVVTVPSGTRSTVSSSSQAAVPKARPAASAMTENFRVQIVIPSLSLSNVKA